ncbi:MAG: MFS transporter, partial [Rhodospirillaceae bacterium]|nr:MFS transporter [Rhodospirillaceae bacterium]
QVPLLVLAAIIHSGLLIPVLAAMVVSNTIGSPAENSLFAKYSPPKWRSTAFGIKFVLALGVASASIPLISWVFAETGEFVWLFLMLTGLSILATVIAAFLPADSTRNTLTD